MPKLKLDASVVAAAVCPPGRKRIDLYCSHNPGLIAEIRASGGKTYYARATGTDGRLKQVKIGRADQISFEQARKKSPPARRGNRPRR